MQPEENYLNSEGALRALAQYLGQDKVDAKLSLLGHSFGTGAALQFAARRSVNNVVLVAPFNTLRQAVAQMSSILAFLMPAQVDNRALIGNLLAADKPPAIHILHGRRDQTLPVKMGRELAAIDSDRIAYYEFANEDHISILISQRDLIFELLAKGRD